MAPAPPKGNALWLTFIGAWRDEAQARGSKAAQTYHKAYKSLSACPIPFQHPCQTTQLVGIGPTIASRLEQELQKWCDENHEAMPERPTATTTTRPRKEPTAGGSKAKGAVTKSVANVANTSGPGGGADGSDDDDDSSDGEHGQAREKVAAGTKRSAASGRRAVTATKKPRSAAQKPYVPQYRSGAYGLLLGLFSRTRPGFGGEEVYLGKAELIEAAQPYSDADYLNGGSGSRATAAASLMLPSTPQAGPGKAAPRSSYSAWTSMKTLIGKGYVYQTGNPPKFCLSEEGYAVAGTMAKEAGMPEAEATIDAEPLPSEAGPSRSTSSRQNTTPDERLIKHRDLSSEVPAFRYAYLVAGEAGRAVLSRSDAAQRSSRSGLEICYLIRFPRSLSSHHTVAHHVEMIEEDDTASDMLTGYLTESKADLVAPGLKAASTGNFRNRSPPGVAVSLAAALTDPSMELERRTTLQRSVTEPSKTNPIRRVPRLSSIVPAPAAESSWHSRLLPPSRTNSGNSGHGGDGGDSGRREMPTQLRPTSNGGPGGAGEERSSSSTFPQPRRETVELEVTLQDKGEEEREGIVSSRTEMLDTVTVRAQDVGSDHPVPHFEPLTMPRGSFTIHFILDNRERRHSREAHGKVSLAGALEAKGVAVEVRALELGDAIWVARRKDGGGAEGDEVVLDFVVERKRLDDLTSSILDGRWKDQKFRLSSSGLSHVLYLIEDHDVDNQMRKFGEQIQTALSSTQVVDGFFVERTAGLDASIEHLARMDRIVREMYEQSDLSILPGSLISRSTYTQLQGQLREARPDQIFLTTFAAYQSLNSKSASLTLRDVFGKMLLCIRGMSAEKIREMLELWQTPREFWEAYEALEAKQGGGGGSEAANMVSNLVDPPEQRKKVGPALSAKMHSMFRSRSYRESVA